MISKNQIKFVNSLKQKKYREEQNLFVAEGNKIVKELLVSSIVVKQVYATSDFMRNNKLDHSIERFEVKENELERISSLVTSNEVLAVCEVPSFNFAIESLQNKLTLVLDEIKDPGNLGTIIRMADWFGIETVVCSLHSADCFNAKVVQATMGSISRIKVVYKELASFFQEFKKMNQDPIYGALLGGENVYSSKLTKSGLIVIGNESRGISETALPFITHQISIPSFSYYKTEGDEAESLNAAIATSIICSEFRRR